MKKKINLTAPKMVTFLIAMIVGQLAMGAGVLFPQLPSAYSFYALVASFMLLAFGCIFPGL